LSVSSLLLPGATAVMYQDDMIEGQVTVDVQTVR
jgi:hypothetical protein